MTDYRYQLPVGILSGPSLEAQTVAFLQDASTRAQWGRVTGRPDVETWHKQTQAGLTGLDTRLSAAETVIAAHESRLVALANNLAALTLRVEQLVAQMDVVADAADMGINHAADAMNTALNHHARHASGAVDALTPADIGAARAAEGVPDSLLALCRGDAPAGWIVCNGDGGTPDLSGYTAGDMHFVQFVGTPGA